ncbi:hypothetical protein [uncultured Vibrio sp.]|uniref:hypothetical protein n=1 Tax=uncultured Vibrio sp. TaxID=114054 RepID=UPI0026358215|nr:hypothetical protein [uncultured Vibrio sp.]
MDQACLLSELSNKTIVDSTIDVEGNTESIAAALEEQSCVMEEVGSQVSNLAQIANANMEALKDCQTFSDQISTQTNQLKANTSSFITG